MADSGSIGRIENYKFCATTSSNAPSPIPIFIDEDEFLNFVYFYSSLPRRIKCGDESYIYNSGRDNTEGDPSPPSLKVGYQGTWKFRWKINPGERTIQINVKQTINQNPRPSLVIKSNSNVGIVTDVMGVAEASADWVTIGPVEITPTLSGSVWVELKNNYTGSGEYPCYWDHIVTT